MPGGAHPTQEHRLSLASGPLLCALRGQQGCFECRTCAQDYTTPEGRVLSRDLTHALNGAIAFLVECRPLSVPMGNAIKALKLQARAPD